MLRFCLFWVSRQNKQGFVVIRWPVLLIFLKKPVIGWEFEQSSALKCLAF